MLLLCRPHPEGPCLAKVLESREHFHGIFSAARDPIRFQALAKVAAGDELHRIIERDDAFLSPFSELRPGSNVLFRPEEVHPASGMREVVEPLPERHRHIDGGLFGVQPEDRSITDFDADGEPAIETRAIDTDRLSGEKPADRQRFNPSLGEPLLPAVDGYTIMGREVVERRKRSDQAGIGEKPSRNPRGKKLLEDFPTLFHR